MFNVNQNRTVDLSGQNIKTDYNPKVKFEINSLNGVLSNLLNELKHYKAKECEQ